MKTIFVLIDGAKLGATDEVGVVVGDEVGTMLQGGPNSMQETKLSWILDWQQFEAPPSRELQPDPPHVPQFTSQHALPSSLRTPVSQPGSFILQGAPCELQSRSVSLRSPMQQLAAPPGRLEHPLPPQVPHSEGQQ